MKYTQSYSYIKNIKLFSIDRQFSSKIYQYVGKRNSKNNDSNNN